MVSKDNAEIVWMCYDCAVKAGAEEQSNVLATMHEDTCDVCGKTTTVTEHRDYAKRCPNCKKMVPLSMWTFTKALKKIRPMCKACTWRRLYGEKKKP